MGRLDVDIIQETSEISKKSAGGQHANGMRAYLVHSATSRHHRLMCDVRHPSSELADMLRECTDGR